MAIFTPIFEPIKEEKKYTGGFMPIIEGMPLSFTPIKETTTYTGGFKPIFEPIEEPTTNEVKVREFQEQWKKDNPIKAKYAPDDYTPSSYLTNKERRN